VEKNQKGSLGGLEPKKEEAEGGRSGGDNRTTRKVPAKRPRSRTAQPALGDCNVERGVKVAEEVNKASMGGKKTRQEHAMTMRNVPGVRGGKSPEVDVHRRLREKTSAKGGGSR